MIPILDVLAPIIDKALSFVPDPQKRAQAKLDTLKELDANSQAILSSLAMVDKAQAETNTEEAKSTNWFVAGWRPFVGWVCGVGVAWAFVLKPIADWILSVARPGMKTPELQVAELLTLLTGMLGFGGMRLYEKIQGVHAEH